MIAATAGGLRDGDTDDCDENDVEGAVEGASIDAPIGASTKCHSTRTQLDESPTITLSPD